MIQGVNFANFVGDGFRANNIFSLNSSGNRDGCYEPYLLLKNLFLAFGYSLKTPDLNPQSNVEFEIHMDARKNNIKVPCYLLLYEAPHMKSINQDTNLLSRYKLIFTWRDDLVDGERYIKLNLPNKLIVNHSRGWYKRDKLSCIISGNKSLPNYSSLDLYSQRVVTIRWFEKNAPQDFDLYGQGWDRPAALSGKFGKVISRIHTYLPKLSSKVHFPSYRGKVVSKHETLQKYRFCICYENIKDLPGYITEKIFDCFFAGCVPIYWGASNITDYIPEDCFIDRRKFSNHEALYQFMINMTESAFIAYQDRIAAFLVSDKAKPFSAEFFAETVVSTIISDLAKI